MNVSVAKSNKWRDKLSIEAYSYVLDKKRNDTYYWVCESRKSMPCRSRVTTTANDGQHVLKKALSAHTHQPTSSKKEVDKTNEYVKSEATKSGLRPSQIISDAIVGCSKNCRVYLPASNAQKQKIKRIRKVHKIPEPETVQDIEIPEEISTVEGENFIYQKRLQSGRHKYFIGNFELFIKTQRM